MGCGQTASVKSRKMNGSVVEMNLIVFIRPYMRFFHLFGQTPYPLNYYLSKKCVEHTKWHRLTLMIPTMFIFALNLTLCVASILLVNIYPYMIRSYNISISVFFFCELIKIFAVLHQNFAKNLMGGILRNFQSIESIFRNSLQCPIEYTSLERAYARKIHLAYGSNLTLMIAVAIYRTLRGKVHYADVMSEIMRFISIAVYMHFLLFIDLLTFHLKHLNKIIVSDIDGSATDREYVSLVKKARTAKMILKQLSKYNMIYLRLWEISEKMNEYFGWSLVALMMLSFVDFVICVIWQLKVLNDTSRFMRLTRKKCFEFHLNFVDYYMQLKENIFPEPLLHLIALAVCATPMFNSSHECQVEVKFICFAFSIGNGQINCGKYFNLANGLGQKCRKIRFFGWR